MAERLDQRGPSLPRPNFRKLKIACAVVGTLVAMSPIHWLSVCGVLLASAAVYGLIWHNSR